MSVRHENPVVQSLGEEIASRLADMEGYFKPGVKLTFLARFPDHPERDIVITSDDLVSLAEMIERRRDAEESS